MSSLQEIIHSLKFNKVSTNEHFYKFKDLEHSLLQLTDSTIIVNDCILTPYYICDGLVYELYEYEFSISLVDEINPNEHLIKKTGVSNINKIPNSIIQLHNKCYIEVLNSENRLLIKDLLNYISFIYGESDIINQISKCFDTFNISNLYFLYY